jgi:hypothetical protein
VGNHKRRLERLEGGRRGKGISLIIVHPGETTEEVLQKHLAQHPEDEKGGVRLILKLSGAGQASPGVPPPPRPEPKYNAQYPGPGPLQITR